MSQGIIISVLLHLHFPSISFQFVCLSLTGSHFSVFFSTKFSVNGEAAEAAIIILIILQILLIMLRSLVSNVTVWQQVKENLFLFLLLHTCCRPAAQFVKKRQRQGATIRWGRKYGLYCRTTPATPSSAVLATTSAYLPCWYHSHK